MCKTFSCIFQLLLVMFLLAGLNACKTMPETKPAEGEKPVAAEEKSAGPAEPIDMAAADAGAEAMRETDTAGSSSEPSSKPQPPTIAASCKEEPYVGYEKQARDSMAKGLAALEAGKYGVGFRNQEEQQKWSDTHQQLFAQVNNACQTLHDCRKENAADKEAKCGEQAKVFLAWQDLAASFAEKAKQAETIQPPIICSFKPNLDDPQHCFHDLADNVDKACDSTACKELSNCWRGVGFLDAAIVQAKRSCGFVHEDLGKCRGYIEAKGRRESKFEQCKLLQGELNIHVIPAL